LPRIFRMAPADFSAVSGVGRVMPSWGTTDMVAFPFLRLLAQSEI
jgi:hypothetical protein